MSNRNVVNGTKARGNGRRAKLDWEANGFEMTDWNEHSYTAGEGCPVFSVAPDVIILADGVKRGLVAKCDGVFAAYFPYGTPPSEIKERLDIITSEWLNPLIDIDAAEVV